MRRWHAAQTAKALLVQRNMRLVMYVVRKSQRSDSMGMHDLVSSGMQGLMTAVEKFDGSKGFKVGGSRLGCFVCWRGLATPCGWCACAGAGTASGTLLLFASVSGTKHNERATAGPSLRPGTPTPQRRQRWQLPGTCAPLLPAPRSSPPRSPRTPPLPPSLQFSTYAHWWVRQRINRELNDQRGVVRLPAHVQVRCPALPPAAAAPTCPAPARPWPAAAWRCSVPQPH
jgi:hypothetical protein